jgi:hypothetical protein
MSDRSYPDAEPAWVDDGEHPGRPVLRWLDESGKPSDEIGVLREIDVPGMNTHAGAQKIQSLPLAKQFERLWASDGDA